MQRASSEQTYKDRVTHFGVLLARRPQWQMRLQKRARFWSLETPTWTELPKHENRAGEVLEQLVWTSRSGAHRKKIGNAEGGPEPLNWSSNGVREDGFENEETCKLGKMAHWVVS